MRLLLGIALQLFLIPSSILLSVQSAPFALFTTLQQSPQYCGPSHQISFLAIVLIFVLPPYFWQVVHIFEEFPTFNDILSISSFSIVVFCAMIGGFFISAYILYTIVSSAAVLPSIRFALVLIVWLSFMRCYQDLSEVFQFVSIANHYGVKLMK